LFLSHRYDSVDRVLAGANTDEEIAFRARHSDATLRDELLAFVKQPQSVHAGFDVVTLLSLDFGPLAFLAASFLASHPLKLIVGKSNELLRAGARKKEILL